MCLKLQHRVRDMEHRDPYNTETVEVIGEEAVEAVGEE